MPKYRRTKAEISRNNNRGNIHGAECDICRPDKTPIVDKKIKQLIKIELKSMEEPSEDT